MDDLCSVPNLTEESLLQDLRTRFEDELIYTYVGTILVSVNPFKFFPIYNPQYCHKYQNRRLGDPSVRPHIFAIADAAFHSLVQNGANQCVVISGESGSGKSEATKMLLYHIMRLSCKASTDGDLNRILGTAPVLEAFGNARTVSNNNSSRFGKFILLQFLQSGSYKEASIEKYLLEKSRVISQSSEERNYHIFYFILAGARQQLKDRLRLTKPEDYNYLNHTVDGQEKCYQVPAIDDKAEFKKLCKSLDDVKFTARSQEEVFTLVAALLHLGNVEFETGEDGLSSVKNEDTLRFVGQLLKVEEATLSLSLTQRTSVIRGAEFTTPFQVNESIDARDATAKALYSYLFDWIVAKVNSVLSTRASNAKLLSIGLLDIFGFENFKVNSFEQFCINYANEQLQQYFNRHIFSYEQEQYQAEGIEWSEVSFTDNTPCLELISKRPTGILHLLDEESKLSTGTDEKLLEKIGHHQKENTYFVMPRKLKNSRPAFTIKHYAGSVTYRIDGFREKNRDMLRPDVIAVLRNSSNPFILRLIGMKSNAGKRWRQVYNTFCAGLYLSTLPQRQQRSSRPGSRRRRKSIKAPNGRKTVRRGSANNEDDPLVSRRMTTAHHQSQQLAVLQKKKVVTVGGNFMVSLSSLMASLSVAEPYFVRCIKSNPNQKPMVFDDKKVMEQLHYLGMVDTIKVRRMGYNLRYPHEDFLSQMRLIISPDILKQSTEPVEKVKEVLKVWNVERRVAQVGKTKVFLRTELTDRLTAQINERLVKYVLVMQRLARAAMARRQFLAIRKGIVAIQSWWRRVLRHRAVRAQRAEQAKQAKQLASVIKIQSMLRACLARQQFAKMQQAHRESEQREKVKETGQAVFAAAASAAKRKASVVAENIAKAAEAAAAAASEAEAAAAAAKKAAEAVVAAADRAEKERKDAEKERKDAEKEHKETKQFAGVRSSASVISLEDAVEAVVAQNKKTAAIERTTSSTQSLDQSPKKASPDKSSSAGAAKPQLQKNRFYSQLVSSPSKKLVKREGHEFRITVFNLPTTCELCKEPITPHLVEGGVCEACHYAVHQQCIINTQKQCKVSKDSSGNRVWEGTVFGASLTQLLVLKDNPVPLLLERCFEQIESRGDKTTDIYKNIPLDQTRLKALKKLLGEDPEKTDIRKTDVHLLCGIVKLFFRELPDPVVPYHMYRDFINTTAVTDVHQQCTEVRDLIEVLPCSHQFALRRLLSHLAVVVTYKDARITAHSLAAVFAPLILSTPKTVKAAESLKHVKLRLRLVENLITTMSARPSFLSDESMDYDDDEGNDSDDDYSGSGFVSPAASSLVISRGSVSSVNTLAPDVQPSLTSTSIPRKAGALNMLGTKTDSDSAISTLGEDSATSSPPPLTSSQSVSSIRNAFQQSLAVTGPGLSSAKSDSGRDSASTDSTSGVKSQACSTSNSTTSAVGTVESSSSRSRVAGLSNKFGHVDKSPTKPPPPVARTKSSIGISMGEESNKAAVARAKPSIGISSGEESNKAAVASAKSSMGINSGKESNNAAVARAKSSIGISSGEESNKAAVARASSSIGISSGEESNTAAVARAKPSIGISWGEESKKAADPDAVTAENASSKPCPVAGKLSTISEKFQKSTESAEPARSSAKPLAPVGASIVSRLRASSTSQISSKVKRAPIFKSPLSTSPPNGSPGNAGSASGSDCENSNQSSKSGVSNLSAMFNKSEDPVARSRKRASLCGSETESELRAALENVLEKGKTFEPGAERGLKSAKSESPKPKIKLPAALQDCGATLPISLSPLQSPHQRSPVRSPVQSPGSSPASPATSPKPALPPKRRESLVFNFDITKERRSSLQSTQSPDAPPAIPQCRSSAGFLSGESSPVSLPTTPLGSAPSSPAISPRNSPPSSPAISPRNSPRRAVRKKKPPPLPGSELQSPRSEPPPLPGSQPRSEPGSPPSDLPPPPLTPPSPMSPMSSKSSLPSMLPQVSAETATPVEEKIDMPELAVATPLHSATKSRPANRGRRPPTRGHRQKMAVTEEAD